jgi:hypothetical protein
VDEETGNEVAAEDIVKGYQVSKGEYIELTEEELDAVSLESTRTIDIDQFVPENEIDEPYLSNPYYIVPDGEVGAQALAVIREAIDQGMVALGRVVFTSREHVIGMKRAIRDWSASRCAILTRCGKRRIISTTSRTKDHQGHARPDARHYFRRRLSISIRRTSKITMERRLRTC